MVCHFAEHGFQVNGTQMHPCGTRYHPQCIRVGPPFATRLRNEEGLSFPNVRYWGTFICEYCTVRSVLERELHGRNDWQLLGLERMRLIDMANAWARKTHQAYQTKMSFIRDFERHYQFQCLPTVQLARPPHNADIPLMWMQEGYSLRRGRSGTNNVMFGTLRSLRSAAGQFLTWNLQLQTDGHSYVDQHRRVHVGPCRLTDNLAYTLFTQGQATRIGDHPNPSTALLHRHVAWIDRDLRRRFRQATTRREQLWLATAGFLNLLLWLGWLRPREALDLRWCDLDVIPPAIGYQHDLPPGMGVLSLRLTPATKTLRTLTADVIIAFRCRSGLSAGWWWAQLRRLHNNPKLLSSTTPLLTRPDEAYWTSFLFRHQVLYPALTTQQLQGDGFLQPFTGDNSIPNKFWSLNSYRRGARTHSQRGGAFRRATDAQVYEHARWRRHRNGQPIDVLYREWSLRDRVLITFYSF